ncbi:hypothetical protein C9I47_1421 [Lysobacter maris]|uniref:Uncharacterized protein n=1 Tax=Marilutibacter maris TaxID=1605891 RepID=A0A2U9T6E9_9GAMM|nr:hypothetical protein C9I47_1421 [Lysobacter maris]
MRRAGIVLAAAYLVYLLLGNLFLNTALAPWAINRKPERFQLHWQAGLTAWPGQVLLWDPRLQGHTGNVTWSLHARRADGRIALLPLLEKELRFPSIEVADVEAALERVDQRLEPAPARPGGWRLRFDRIASDSVRGARFGTLRLDGEGQATLGLYKQLRGGPLELTPSRVRFERARLSLADDTLLDEAVLEAGFSIDRHTREQASGLRKLLETELELSVEGRTSALQVQRSGPQRLNLKPVPAAGHGRVGGRIGWNRGALAPGGRLDWSAPVSMASRDGQATLQLGVEVDDDIRLRIDLPRQVDENGDALAVDARLRIEGIEVPLGDPRSLIPRTSGHLVGSWQFASLDWLGTFFADAPWLALEGAGRVDADLRLVDGAPAAGSRVEVPGVDVSVDLMGNRVQGRARALGTLQGDEDAGAGGVRPRLELNLERFSITADKGRGARYVEGRDLSLHVQAVEPLATGLLAPSGAGAGASAGPTPGAALARAGRALKARLRFEDASVPDLRAYNRYLPRSQLRFEGGSGRLSGDLSVDGAGAVGQGWLRVRGRDTRLHAAGMALRGNVDINTRLRRAGIEDGRFNIDGSQVRLDNISLVEPDGEVRRGWWARIDLTRARLDWDPARAAGRAAGAAADVDIDGHARITARDVGFLLALYARQRDYPGWVGRLIDAGQARVTGDVRWRDDVLIFDNLVANNDRFDVNARLRLQGQDRRGNLYARWGVLSMAVDLDGAHREYHLLRARRWYDAQPAYIR